MLRRLFVRFISDKRAIKNYISAGAVFGDAVSYLGHGQCVGFEGRLDRYAAWEREIVRRGYVPYCVDQFAAFGGYGRPLPLLRKGEPDEEIVSHAEFYRREFLGKVTPAVDLSAVMAGEAEAVWATWRQPSTENLLHSQDQAVQYFESESLETGFTVPGWYFPDEAGEKVYGPFANRKAAAAASLCYRHRDDVDQFMYRTGPWLTQPELDVLRDEIEKEAAVHGHSAGDTCADCEVRFGCKYSFDPYNTNGDCLASK